MADSTLDHLRQDALHKRVNGIAGGLRILWSTRDVARLTDFITSAPANLLLRDVPGASRKPIDTNVAAVRRKLSEKGTVVRDIQPGDRSFMFTITSEAIDLSDDCVKVDGVDFDNFAKNPVVLNGHDSTTLPVAVSTTPRMSGASLTAVAKFPQDGVSDASDLVAAAIRENLVRGASIGFIPLKWSFSKDPSRPFGVDFLDVKLLEWSVCGIPCNPSCLLLGSVGGKSASRRSRNAQTDEVPDEVNDWQCQGEKSLPLDVSDDAFDATSAKAALLSRVSPQGSIIAEATDYFLASDISAPLVAKSYQFPFAKVTDSGVVASKTAWRQSLAALEKSTMQGLPVSDARALVDRLEARLGDVKTAARRREARMLAAEVKTILASTVDDPAPRTRAQRLAEAHNFRAAAINSGVK
jgi:hypothetical protein